MFTGHSEANLQFQLLRYWGQKDQSLRPAQQMCETLSEKQTKSKSTEDMAQVVEQ
jgi:hypothetical protein